jgi:hypothetical protein
VLIGLNVAQVTDDFFEDVVSAGAQRADLRCYQLMNREDI